MEAMPKYVHMLFEFKNMIEHAYNILQHALSQWGHHLPGPPNSDF